MEEDIEKSTKPWSALAYGALLFADPDKLKETADEVPLSNVGRSTTELSSTHSTSMIFVEAEDVSKTITDQICQIERERTNSTGLPFWRYSENHSWISPAWVGVFKALAGQAWAHYLGRVMSMTCGSRKWHADRWFHERTDCAQEQVFCNHSYAQMTN